ncbi:MAG TPA: putative basic amino acid antiporter YfcC [Lentisphaeria bacterium]|nr:MAG: hypothetical protein A2X47_09580 [Lentisphaerae bacterium GWF2_38_69]HBM17078.1 putative basic amino acid antiporter YfcC [Lentisphaeria bacterium]
MSEVSSFSQKTKMINIPDTLVILFIVVFVVYLLSFIVPAGKFDTHKVSYETGGITKSRTVVVADSYQVQKNAQGVEVTSPPSFFGVDGNRGFLNFVYDGMTSGSRNGGAIGIMIFILIIGGAFGIIMRTGVIEAGIMKIIGRLSNRKILILPVLICLFSLGGAIFGMSEEAIPFALILAPMMVAMGYDSITAVLVSYLATQVGFATSWMNPFSVAVAQGIANVPVLSGAFFRIVMWAVFTASLIVFTVAHARSIQKNPSKSMNYQGDEYFRNQLSEFDFKKHFGITSWLIITVLFAGIIWVIYGVIFENYYIPELATQFFSMGLLIGLIASLGRINDMNINALAKSFKSGAADLLPAAIIVGMANGIVQMMGGDNPGDYTMLNTFLHESARLCSGLNEYFSAIAMFIAQAFFNFLITSGSGQAALTMPLMAPLSDLVGVGRQIAVLAFQLGDGWTHCIMPVSAALMGTLGVARIEYGIWFKFILKFYLYLMLLSIGFMILAVMINYQ